MIPATPATYDLMKRNLDVTTMEMPSTGALVVVGHGAEAPLLHGQTRLGAVERLDLCSHVLVYEPFIPL